MIVDGFETAYTFLFCEAAKGDDTAWSATIEPEAGPEYPAENPRTCGIRKVGKGLISGKRRALKGFESPIIEGPSQIRDGGN